MKQAPTGHGSDSSSPEKMLLLVPPEITTLSLKLSVKLSLLLSLLSFLKSFLKVLGIVLNINKNIYYAQ